MKLFVTCFLIPSLPVASWAEAATLLADHTVELSRFDVTATRNLPLTVPGVDEARNDLARTPGGAEVVDYGRYARGRASNLQDVFAFSPGVIAQSRFGSDEARISIRGSGLQRTFHGRGVRVLQDGVPLNLADGSFDMQAFEPLAAQYVNVWRGANALALGASTLGGAIDFVSRTGREAPSIARLEAGSFGYHRGFAGAGFSKGRMDTYAAFTRTTHDGFRAHAGQRNSRLLANAGWRLTDLAETRFYVTAVSTDSELPGSLLKREVEENPRLANAASAMQDQKRDFELLRGASKTTLRWRDTLIDATLGWTYKDLDHPIATVVDQLSNDTLVSLAATRVAPLAGHRNRFGAGAMWTRNRLHATNYVNVLGKRGALTAQADNVAENHEAWVENQWSATSSLTLILGSTFAWNRRLNAQEIGGTGSYSRRYENASPKIGWRWDGESVQLFGNVSDSYEPPSFSETGALAAPNRAQRARTVEVGTRGHWRILRWDVAAYRARLRDEFLSLNDATGLPLGTVNAPSTLHDGVEVGAELDLLGGTWDCDGPTTRLVARGAWTYGRFRFEGDPLYGSNTLAGLPSHTIRAELNWESSKGWYGGPNVEWVPGETPVDFANTQFADGYAVYGMRVGRRVDRGFSWFAEVRNVLDEHYVATTGVIADARGLDVRQFLPGEVRSLYGGIEYRW